MNLAYVLDAIFLDEIRKYRPYSDLLQCIGLLWIAKVSISTQKRKASS